MSNRSVLRPGPHLSVGLCPHQRRTGAVDLDLCLCPLFCLTLAPASLRDDWSPHQGQPPLSTCFPPCFTAASKVPSSSFPSRHKASYLPEQSPLTAHPNTSDHVYTSQKVGLRGHVLGIRLPSPPGGHHLAPWPPSLVSGSCLTVFTRALPAACRQKLRFFVHQDTYKIQHIAGHLTAPR